MNAMAARPNYGLWRQVGKLLRLSWFMSLMGFLRAGRRRKIGLIVLGLVVVAGVAVIFLASWGL
ncbi:MAG: hypothetical protein ACM3JD_18815, partial [Rudaea sp.]